VLTSTTLVIVTLLSYLNLSHMFLVQGRKVLMQHELVQSSKDPLKRLIYVSFCFLRNNKVRFVIKNCINYASVMHFDLLYSFKMHFSNMHSM